MDSLPILKYEAHQKHKGHNIKSTCGPALIASRFIPLSACRVEIVAFIRTNNNLTGRGTVILRRQSDGNWLIVIESPWGTD